MKLPKAKKLPSGSWNVQVMVSGKRVSVTAPTEKEAVAKAAEIKAGGLLPEKKDRFTLTEAIDKYIEDREVVLSPATIRGYRRIQKKRLQSIMQADIYTLDRETIQRAVAEDTRAVSAKTVRNAYGLVSAVLGAFCVQIDGIKLPMIVRKKKQYLQPEDIGKLIEAVQGDSCEIQILLAVWLGMRRSEICGLCWDSIDLDKGTIYIHRAKVPNDKGEYVIKEEPKNRSSVRVIDCPDYILDKIKLLPKKREPLFSQHPEILSRHVHKVCRTIGITDTTMHGLRHTNAAVMKSLGVDDAHAMARGGWSSEATYKKVYSYVFDSEKDTADAAINSFFNQKLQMNLQTEKD